MKKKSHNTDTPLLFLPERFRVLILVPLFLAGFLTIAFRLYSEQISNGDERRRKATSQSVRRIRVPAQRGRIFSSDGKTLAGNIGTRKVVFFPEEMRNGKNTISAMVSNIQLLYAAVGRKITLSPGEIARQRRKNPSKPLTVQDKLTTKVSTHLRIAPTMPLTILDNLTPLEAARAMEFARTVKGAELIGGSVRSYPEHDCAAQLIGYTGDSKPKSKAEEHEFNYYVPDCVGRAGAERAFDAPCSDQVRGLIGEPGFAVVQVNNRGYIHRRHFGRSEPFDGNHVILTLNYRAQKLAEELLGSRRGAIVVLNAGNGAVLAAASSPRFDLNRFSPEIPPDYYQQLREDPNHPLLNRATLGSYTPGSIMKVLVAMALMDAGWNPETKINCDGGAHIGNARIRCSATYGHGPLDLKEAIKHSCNTYMIEAARRIGWSPIAQVMNSAGIGRRTGVEIEEAAGVLPSPEAKKVRYRGRWNAFDTALISIGQGMVILTPLQAANVAAAIANYGVWYRPHLLERVVDTNGRSVWQKTPEFAGKLHCSKQALNYVRKAMHMVVNDPGGSGHLAKREGLTLYGKTGSAEVGPRDNRTKTVWFIAFTEYKNTKYAFAAVIENGNSGGKDCAPLAGAFFEKFLLKEKKE